MQYIKEGFILLQLLTLYLNLDAQCFLYESNEAYFKFNASKEFLGDVKLAKSCYYFTVTTLERPKPPKKTVLIIDSALNHYSLFNSENLNHEFLQIKVNSTLSDSLRSLLNLFKSDTSYFTLSSHMSPTLDTIKSIKLEHLDKGLYLDVTALDGLLSNCESESRQIKALSLVRLFNYWIEKWFSF